MVPALKATDLHRHLGVHGHKHTHHKKANKDNSATLAERGIPVPGGGADVNKLPLSLPFPNRYVFFGAPGPSDPPAPQAGEEPMLLAGTSMMGCLQDILNGVKGMMQSKLFGFGQRLHELELHQRDLSDTLAAKADRAVADSLLAVAKQDLKLGGTHVRDLQNFSLGETVLGSAFVEDDGTNPQLALSQTENEAEAEVRELKRISVQLRMASDAIAEKVNNERVRRLGRNSEFDVEASSDNFNHEANLANSSGKEAPPISADRAFTDMEELSGKLHTLSRECTQETKNGMFPDSADQSELSERDVEQGGGIVIRQAAPGIFSDKGEYRANDELCRVLAVNVVAFSDIAQGLEAAVLRVAVDGEETWQP